MNDFKKLSDLESEILMLKRMCRNADAQLSEAREEIERLRAGIEALPRRCKPFACAMDEDMRKAGVIPEIGWYGPSVQQAVDDLLKNNKEIL